MSYLREINSLGVRNLEMESLCLGAMCYRANIRGGLYSFVPELIGIEGSQFIDTADEKRMCKLNIPYILMTIAALQTGRKAKNGDD